MKGMTTMSKSTYLKPEYFYNRELSWLLFNYRVLGEAQDKNIPLLDRLNFIWCVWHL